MPFEAKAWQQIRMGSSAFAILAKNRNAALQSDDLFAPRLRVELIASQVRSLLAHTSTASAISTVAALILSIYLAPVAGNIAVQAWFALKVAVALPRFVLGQAYQRAAWRPRARKANRIVLISLAVDGAVWGLVGIWCASWQSDAVAGLLLGCLSSVAMLATFGLQIQLRATAAFVLPIMLPMATALALRGDAMGITGAGGALLVLVQTLVTGYASEKRVKREFLAHHRLEHALKDRSQALDLASKSSQGLEEALVQVQRQSAVKALFLATMSHELRTPLHGILGLNDLIRRRTSDPTVSHHLSLIQSSGTHLLELIGALLDVSRIDAGRLELHPVPMDLDSEIRGMADLYEVRCDTKGIAFRSSMAMEATCWVRADAGRIRQILHNLLGNAVKFTKRGTVEFRATQDGDRFCFEVIDTGPGIAADEIPHIFEAFRQAGESVARPADGTGLGLTIARELALAMGGDISASSTLGAGSSFRFSASFELVAPPDEVVSIKKSRIQLKSVCHVLLVEDNDVNALIAQAHLESFGALTRRVHNGEEAVHEATRASRPDVVLMDCRMPVMDGLAATRAIRQWETETSAQRLPIIALTATPSADDRAECLASGMDGFLPKPFTENQLFDVLKKHLVVETRRGPSLEGDALYEFATSLGDSEDFLPGATMH